VDIEFRRKNSKTWIVEVWEDLEEMTQHDTLSEERYVEINEWCKQSFGYHARTAYHIFELRKRSHLEWFILRWS
jgi:hypothetical protein